MAKNIEIVHLDDSRIYMSSLEDIIRMFQAADSLVKNDEKVAIFHKDVFYKLGRELLDEL